MDLAIELILSILDVAIKIAIIATPFVVAVILLSIPIRKISNIFTEHCFRNHRDKNDIR